MGGEGLTVTGTFPTPAEPASFGQVRIPLGAVAVVTGASRGLGAGLAEAFAGAGVRLGLCARHLPVGPSEGADRAPAPGAGGGPGAGGAPGAGVGPGPGGAPGAGVGPVAGAPGDVGAHVRASLDVADAGALDRFAGEVLDRFGRIDLWVNNAGVLAPIGPLADADPGEMARHVGTNVLGVLYGSAVFARHVRSRPGVGVLVNISSGAATSPYEGWGPYCASKAAVEMATEVVAREEAAHGLRAYALAPGVVDTDMQALVRSTPAERFPAVSRFLALKESGAFNSPARVASTILGLAFGEHPPAEVRVRVAPG